MDAEILNDAFAPIGRFLLIAAVFCAVSEPAYLHRARISQEHSSNMSKKEQTPVLLASDDGQRLIVIAVNAGANLPRVSGANLRKTLCFSLASTAATGF